MKHQIVYGTNCKDDINNIDVMFILSTFKSTDIELISSNYNSIFSDKILEYFNKNNFKYFITGEILCAEDTLVGRNSYEDYEKISNHCINNCYKFIAKIKPNILFIIGDKGFVVDGINKKIKIHHLVDLKDQKLTEEAFEKIKEVLTPPGEQPSDDIDFKIDLDIKEEDLGEPVSDLKPNIDLSGEKLEIEKGDHNTYMYKIPHEYLKPIYRLEDVQYEPFRRYLLMIMRDDKNKKICHKIILPENNFYWYEGTNQNEWVKPCSELMFKIGPYKNRNKEESAYEGDFKIADKFIADYYLQKKEECDVIKRNIFKFDIEVFLDGERKFPDPAKAEKRINAISFRMDEGDTQTYLLWIEGKIDPKITKQELIKKYSHVTIFDNEKVMLTSFIKKLHSLEPTFLSGWNSDYFDIPYIINRIKNLGINVNDLSPFGYVQTQYGLDILGYVSMDLEWLYKGLVPKREASYTLENISFKILKKSKEEVPDSLDELYYNIEQFVKYSITDVDLLQGLTDKLMHLDMQDELRKVTGISHKTAMSTIGQADGLFYSHLKTNGYSFINSKHNHKAGIPGGFVKDPVGGRYDWVIDFDYTSQYPSVINSTNLGPNTYLAKFTESLDPELQIVKIAYDYIYDRQSLKYKKIDLIINPISTSKYQTFTLEELEKFLAQYNAIVTVNGTIFKGHNIEKSIFYDIIAKLFEQRKIYKKLMKENKGKDDHKFKIYFSRQHAYKILLNSLYGVLANEHFRFYNLDLASTITSCGRELIKYAGEHVNSYMVANKEVQINPNFIKDILKPKEYFLYCDTDSSFLWIGKYLEDNKIEINKENIHKEIDRTQNYINNNLLNTYCQYHNIPLDKSMFEMKNEKLARRYFTLNNKKHYALKGFEKEGQLDDEIDIVGLESVRSDIPDFSKPMIEHLVYTILNEDELNIDKIYEYIETKKKEAVTIIENRGLSIFNTESFTKELSEYKNMPQHIRGMLIFNELEYDHFRKGHRGYLVNISGIDMNKAPQKIRDNFNQIILKKWKPKDLNCIVLPETYKIVPEYYIINTNKVISFCVQDRCDLLLEPLVKKDELLLSW
jgi:DNA polymerase elongation subunit (family B)